MKKKWLIALFSVLFVLTGALGLTSCVGEGGLTGCNAHTHAYTSVVTDATCLDGGYTTYTCECGYSYVGDHVEALGHDYSNVIDNSREATCETNRVDLCSCSRCPSIQDVEIENTALGHDYGDYTSEGKGVHTRQCRRDSSHIETQNCSGGVATCESRAVCEMCQKEYGELGHIIVVEGREETCTKNGWREESCSLCGMLNREVFSMRGHLFGDWYVVKESTGSEAGQERRDCCECSYFETKESALEGHEYVYEAQVEPTCEEYGYDRYKCQDCDHFYRVNFVPKKNHEMTQSKVEATCTTDGYVLHECKDCEYSYITDHESKLGHEYGEWTSDEKLTCTTGITESRKCQRCDHTEERSVLPEGHHYILIEVVTESDKAVASTYKCDRDGCDSTVSVEGEKSAYETKKESELLDEETDFEFIVVCTQADPETYINENLKVYYDYYQGTDYEEDAVHFYTLSKLDEVENGWKVSPEKPYVNGLTYIAKISGNLAFADYYGQKLTFSIKGKANSDDQQMKIKEDVLFLGKLENDNPGYAPYKLIEDENDDYFYAVVQKVDAIEIGKIIYIGTATNLDGVAHDGGRFGKVEGIRVNDGSEYILVLTEPALDEIFANLDVHRREEVILEGKEEEVAAAIEATAAEALYASDDFAEFLAASEISLQNYCKDSNLVAASLTKESFKEKVTINKPVVWINGTEAHFTMSGSFATELKTKSGKVIGAFKMGFDIKAMVGFEVSADIKIKTVLGFIPVGLNYFDIRLTQKDKFEFDFSVKFNVDYELAPDELLGKYVYNKTSLKIHTTTCSYYNDPDRAHNDSNWVIIQAAELEEYAQKPGYTKCSRCKPIENRDRSTFVRNKATGVVHCFDVNPATGKSCVSFISQENIEYLYSLKSVDREDYCEYCTPQKKAERDFDAEMLRTIGSVNWAAKVKEIKEMAADAGVEEYKSEGVSLCKYSVPFAGIFAFNVDVRLVLSFKFEASVDYYYTQGHTNVYGFRISDGRAETYSWREDEETISELTVMGSMEFKIGIKGDLNVSIIGLSKLARAGFTIEAGLYMEADGILHVSNSTTENNYAAIYFEAGPYIDIQVYYKLLFFEGSATIYAQKFPIFVYGYEKAYFAYVNDIDKIAIKGDEEYNLETSGLLDVSYYDVRNHQTKTETLSVDEEVIYSIIFEPKKSGANCVFMDGKLKAADDAPCTFTEEWVLTISGNTTWKKYVKGSSAFYLDKITITVSYSGGGNHSFTEYVGVRAEGTCKNNRIDIFQCEHCAETEDREIENTKVHAYGEWVWKNTTEHERTCMKDDCDVSETRGHKEGDEEHVCVECGGWYNAYEYIVEYHDQKPDKASGNVVGMPDSIRETWMSYECPHDLPKLTLTGWKFGGWKNENGTIVDGTDDLTREAGVTVHLYADWTAIKYNIRFEANRPSSSGYKAEGNMSPVNGATYDEVVNLPMCGYTIESWKFVGWSTSADGNVLYGNGASVSNLASVANSSVTLYAQWERISYYVNVKVKDGSKTEPSDTITLVYGNSYELKWDDWKSKFGTDYQFDGWFYSTAAGEKGELIDAAGNHTISNLTTIDGATIYILGVCHYVAPPPTDDGGGGCVTGDTLITLADGSQIPVEEMKGDELLLVWNLYTGSFDVAPNLFIDYEAPTMYEIINLTFSDGTKVRVIDEHAFWDFDLNQYVYIRADAAQYEGHWFNKQITDENGDMAWTKVQLVDVTITKEYEAAWSPVTYGHLCFYVNGMLSMPGATEGLINIFEVDAETMQINQEQYLLDVETYGLFTYEEFAEIMPVPETIFEAFNGQYLKISMGKGLIDYERLSLLIDRYTKFF